MKKVVGLFLALSLLISALCVFKLLLNASAASMGSQDGLEVSILTDKNEYSVDEDIQVSINIKNNNSYKVEDIFVKMLFTEGLVIKSEDLTTGITIEAGESYSAKVTAQLSERQRINQKFEDTSKYKDTNNKQNRTSMQTSDTSKSKDTDNKQDRTSPQTNDTSNIFLWIILIISSAIGLMLIIKHKKIAQMLILFLCLMMILFMLPIDVLAAENNTTMITVDKTIIVDGKEYSIKANVSYLKDAIDPNCIISFDTSGGSPIESQIIKKGETVSVPNVPEKGGFAFVGWYIDAEYSELFDYSKSIRKSCTVYARWVDVMDTTDTDGDGLTDAVEEFYGTSSSLIDTDQDGLSDYIEIVVLNYDPLNSDTDNNGTSDGEEDFDNDEIKNKFEIELGIDPTLIDTDGDGLADNIEINTYRTSPILSDTDNDGANDGWEVVNEFDPLVYNDSFSVEIKSEESIEDNHIVASVAINTNGAQVSTLKVEPVSENVEPLLSSSIPGYLGTAYDFSINGNITSATISFEYDYSLGTVSNEFQPRIYYFNEEQGTLEELVNQNVSNGKVSAVVSHFSKYILLNKVEFDKVWESEIKPPLSSGNFKDEATLDIMFVIDYSSSMDDNDHYQLFKSLSEDFVNKLRDSKDKAGAVKFIRQATLVSELNTDKESIITAINDISYDDGYGTYSGTDGSTGIKMALDELAKSDSEYQYIVFITDGEDNGYAYSYDALIEIAKQSSVTIYSIGMGSASEATLEKISSATGGKYYHATTDVSVDDLINLDEVFDDIKAETVDLTTDSNEDKIPDYYNELIKNGILTLSNGSDEFAGIDFNIDKNGNESDDYDGDGLKNGEELRLIQSGNIVYLEMNSNPIINDTDGDGFIDAKDTAPLDWDVSDRDLAMCAAMCYENGNAAKDNNRFYLQSEIKGNPDVGESGESYYFSGFAYASEMADKWRVIDYTEDNRKIKIDNFSATTYKNKNNIIIAFRGTNEDLEWLDNVVCYGLNNYHSEEAQARAYARSIVKDNPDCNIYITGHSLGGYLAQIGTAELVQKKMDSNLIRVVYFNGIGVAFNPVLEGIKSIDKIALYNFSHDFLASNHKLVSYAIKGDWVHNLGTHQGDTIEYYAAERCVEHHRSLASNEYNGPIDIGGLVLSSVVASPTTMYYYAYYGVPDFVRFTWLTHETDSFFYHLTLDTRNYK